MRTTLLFPAVVLAFLFIAGAAEPKLPTKPPAKFLQTDIQAWHRVLATEITADFRASTIREVIDYLARRSHANIVLSLDALLPPAQAEELPLITRQFQRVPLRTVFYQISQDTGLTIDWHYEKSFPHAIRIRNQ